MPGKFKEGRAALLEKYKDAIYDLFLRYEMDTFVCFEMLLANARAFSAGEQLKYTVSVPVDYAELAK